MALHINMTILNRFTTAPSRKYPFIYKSYVIRVVLDCFWCSSQHPFAMDRFARAFRFHHPLQIVRRLMRIRTQVICKWIQNSTSIYNLKWCHSGVRVFCAGMAHSRTCHILTCNFILYIYSCMYLLEQKQSNNKTTRMVIDAAWVETFICFYVRFTLQIFLTRCIYFCIWSRCFSL